MWEVFGDGDSAGTVTKILGRGEVIYVSGRDTRYVDGAEGGFWGRSQRCVRPHNSPRVDKVLYRVTRLDGTALGRISEFGLRGIAGVWRGLRLVWGVFIGSLFDLAVHCAGEPLKVLNAVMVAHMVDVMGDVGFAAFVYL